VGRLKRERRERIINGEEEGIALSDEQKEAIRKFKQFSSDPRNFDMIQLLRASTHRKPER